VASLSILFLGKIKMMNKLSAQLTLLFAMLLTAGQTAPVDCVFDCEKALINEIAEKNPRELAYANSLRPRCWDLSYNDCYLNRDQAGYLCCLLSMEPEIEKFYLDLPEEDPVKQIIRTFRAPDIWFLNDHPELLEHPDELAFYASLPDVQSSEDHTAESIDLQPIVRWAYRDYFSEKTRQGYPIYELYLKLSQDNPCKKEILEKAKEYEITLALTGSRLAAIILPSLRADAR
jgi:hypothetical protein